MLGTIAHRINIIPLYFFIRNATSILDVGCGVNSAIPHFIRGDQRLDGVDASEYAIQRLNREKYKNVYHEDIRNFQDKGSYDVIIAIDVIEHLEKEEGHAVLEKLERIALKRVIILTPNGFVEQGPAQENFFQEHKSGWTADEFRARGYRVYGMLGPKGLREESAVLKYRPKVFWGLIATLACLVYFWMPSRSFSLLAIYDKSK